MGGEIKGLLGVKCQSERLSYNPDLYNEMYMFKKHEVY